ncbi:cbb3-type cytochrome oxidase assembly protein CcoS [Thiomicrorhabdus sp. 6S3-12]|uniref:cbb3-type cytochrome oxidase assembly protein CcoS n=1 Tax=Thiomicrorhabdus sp. 6S3-12 TaxID=2819681 RepID=UPI001AAC799B|nr:cbb3-type cytochrome oxidase assembly protein CcoS [Thiomicrorhabdus sp. 6S3-12]
MDVIYGLIPMMLFFGFLVVVVFIWMAKKGYFDDMDGQANRILMDDDDFQPSAKQEQDNKGEASSEQGSEVEQTKDTAADK